MHARASVNLCGHTHGFSPLQLAVERQHINMIKRLLLAKVRKALCKKIFEYGFFKITNKTMLILVILLQANINQRMNRAGKATSALHTAKATGNQVRPMMGTKNSERYLLSIDDHLSIVLLL